MIRAEAANAGTFFLQKLSPMIMPIFRLLESGSAEAYGHLDTSGARYIDNYCFSMMVREHVCRGLDDLLLFGDLPFKRIRKANCGIEIYFDGIRLKVLRPGVDDDGEVTLPSPKNDQQELFYLANRIPDDPLGEVYIENLVMMWESNHSIRSTQAWLACPYDGADPLFTEYIPHPVTRIVMNHSNDREDDELDNFRRIDEEQPRHDVGAEQGDEGEDE